MRRRLLYLPVNHILTHEKSYLSSPSIQNVALVEAPEKGVYFFKFWASDKQISAKWLTVGITNYAFNY